MAKYIIIAVLVIALLGGAGWYVTKTNYGAEVDPPVGLKDAIDVYFAKTNQLPVQRMKILYCSGIFSLDDIYVADISLDARDFHWEKGTALPDIDWKIRANVDAEGNWQLFPSKIKTSKRPEPCNLH